MCVLRVCAACVYVCICVRALACIRTCVCVFKGYFVHSCCVRGKIGLPRIFFFMERGVGGGGGGGGGEVSFFVFVCSVFLCDDWSLAPKLFFCRDRTSCFADMTGLFRERGRASFFTKIPRCQCLLVCN